MRYESIKTLVSPANRCPLDIEHIEAEAYGEIKEGILIERLSGNTVPIRNFIPRFVEHDSYTASFGKQWNRYRRTQIDRFNGTTFSAKRFYDGTGWAHAELQGQRILEVGCGAGRFTQVMLDAGAEVYALDYSTAVDACWTNNGPHPQLSLVQADLYAMPFPPGFFDNVFCYGVLQHTPDVKRAFMSLLPFLKPGGRVAVDLYVKSRWPSRWTSKYVWRALTKRLPHELLFHLIEGYVPLWLPIDNWLKRIPRFGHYVIAVVPCWNYTGTPGLTPDQIREWAILDTFDALSAWYDSPQTMSEVRAWFEEAGLHDISVAPGGNGILGNAQK